ncbi:MAG: DNA mismatch repair protein MutS [Candidatus Woesearchaeota archaeon]
MLKRPKDSDIPKDEELTPAMRQFKRFKQEYPDSIIFFRMGDFYEVFFEDAKIVAKELEITLTKRGTKHQVPLAGIPFHAVDTYLPRMVKKGYKVAICEQIEDPKEAKGVVKRDVIRVVTPGTLTNSTAIEDTSNNFLMTVAERDDNDSREYGIAVVDLSTGEFMTSEFTDDEKLIAEISRFMPSELLIEEKFIEESKNNEVMAFLKNTGIFINTDKRSFDYARAYRALTSHFGSVDLKGIGIEDKDLCITSAGILIGYLNETQKMEMSNITRLRTFFPEDYMLIDSATQRNLEIAENLSDGSKRNTLLEVIDQTKTSMGARMLKQWIKRPLLDRHSIEQRLDVTGVFKEDSFTRNELAEKLSKIHDIERLISRVSLRSANPRDMIALRESLRLIPEISSSLANAYGTRDLSEDHLFGRLSSFPSTQDIVKILDDSLRDDPPNNVREGNMIKKGFDERLDELRDIIDSGKRWILELETQEREKLGINVKVGFNKVFGYYIEVSRRNVDKVPEGYIRKQTTANAERYITEELKEKEEIILNSEERINTLEYKIFNEILDKISERISELQKVAHKISYIDILCSLSRVAHKNSYTRPKMTDDYDLMLRDTRHPVIEQIENNFIPNDVSLDFDTRMMIITGPNMAGKSTYMRQVASIVLLAQIGSFVPASRAEIGICDRIFSRVGARDDLASGRSTFMVEMHETANILNNATSKSLILLDEIGRGTSTFDGVSIAWSVAEYINNRIKAKTLFATHYHALNKLSTEYKEIKNYNIAVKEKDEDIIFLRKIVEGGTNKSYGIQVARLAGLPPEVVLRSKEIMRSLEKADATRKSVSGKKDNGFQASLFDI